MTEKFDTQLTDDEGNKLYAGDTIEWSYSMQGVINIDKDGVEKFFPCISAYSTSVKDFKEVQKIKYEVRGDIAGYFLDRPHSISMTFMPKPTCKKVFTEK